MRLLIVTTGYPPVAGGFVRNQVRALARYAESVTVLAPRSDWRFWRTGVSRIEGLFCEKDPVAPNVMVCRPSYVKLPGTTLLSWTCREWERMAQQMCLRLGRETPVSFLHGHHGGAAGWAAAATGKRLGIPSGVTFHGSDINQTLVRRRKGWEICEGALLGTDLPVFVSHALRASARSVAAVPERSRVHYIGVDVEFFNGQRPDLHRRDVLFVGRIEEKKGVFDLLQAWALLGQHHAGHRLILIGEDRTQGKALRMAAELGICTAVDFRGAQSQIEVSVAMRNAQVFCLPSQTEGMPTVVMEAMASATPVIAARTGGMPEVVRTGVTGFLIEPGDARGLAKAISEALSKPGFCDVMGNEARRFARAELDVNRNTGRLYGEFLRVIESRGERHCGSANTVGARSE